MAAMFIAGLGALLWAMQDRMLASERRALRGAAGTVQESLRQRVHASRDYLTTLAEDMARGAVTEELFSRRLTQYLADHPELVSVVYVDAAGRVQWVVPSGDRDRQAGVPLACPESRAGHAAARRTRGPVYSPPHVSLQGEPAFDLNVPIFRGETFLGTFVGIYSCERMLRHILHREIVQKHQISLVDGDGHVIVPLPRVASVDPRLVQSVRLAPPGHGVSLRLSRYGAGFWGVGLTLLVLLCVGLVVGMAWGMWQLNRQVARRAQAEADLREARDGLAVRVRERTVDLEEANRRLQEEIVERQRAERRARQRQEELAHVARVSTMGEMAAGLAHELNQPLGAIAGFADGCSRMIDSGRAEPAELSGAMQEVSEQAVRAGRIIRRLRAFVARSAPATSTVDLRQLVREVVDLLAMDLRQNRIALELDIPDDLPVVRADGIQVQQVLLNLMRNAIEAVSRDGADEGRLVVAATASDAGAVEVAVSDDGPGCGSEAMDQLFEAFYTTKASGLGMGLSISRSIVEAHGGRLWATPNDGRGMTFRFTLPGADGDSRDDTEQG